MRLWTRTGALARRKRTNARCEFPARGQGLRRRSQAWPALFASLLCACGVGGGIYRAGTHVKTRTQTHSYTERRNVDGSVTRSHYALEKPLVHHSGTSGSGFSAGVEVGPWWGDAGPAGRQRGFGVDAYLEYTRAKPHDPRARSTWTLGWAVRSGLGARSLDKHPGGFFVPIVWSLLVGAPYLQARVGAGPLFGKLNVGSQSTGILAGFTTKVGVDLVLPFKAVEFLVGPALQYVISDSASVDSNPYRYNDIALLFRVMIGL